MPANACRGVGNKHAVGGAHACGGWVGNMHAGDGEHACGRMGNVHAMAPITKDEHIKVDASNDKSDTQHAAAPNQQKLG